MITDLVSCLISALVFFPAVRHQPVNPTEVYTVHVELLGVLNSIFEIWLGFTFAAIVAYHFAAPTMHRVILGVTLTLYVLASYVFAARYFHTMQVFGFLNDELQEVGIQAYPAPSGEISLFLLVIFVVGSISTVVYPVLRYRGARQSNASKRVS